MAQKGEVQSRPWSKYSKGSSAYTRLHPEDKPMKRKTKTVEVDENEDLSDDAKKELAENKKKKGMKWCY